MKPLFPNAKLLTQRKEWDTFASLHPMQWAWYVEDGIEGVNEENVVMLDGDVELGQGVALVWTPGHTDGNHSLCINTDDGVKYENMVMVLDLSRKAGYPKTLLAGGPPSADPTPGAPAAPAGG